MLAELLKFVEEYLDDGMSLFDAFLCFAKQNGFTAKSVKKCYTAAITGLKERPKLAKKMEINLPKLTDPANVFNMAAVLKYLKENNLSLDKGLFALCLGDKTEMYALKNRFSKFFPEYETKPKDNTVTLANATETDLTPSIDQSNKNKAISFALSLQSKYC